MSKDKLVWSSEGGTQDGDKRKSKDNSSSDAIIDLNNVTLKLRRLTAGKGRTVIEISELPANKPWCQKLAKDLKKSLGTGGTFKDGYIEIHGERLDALTALLDKKSIKWKKTGG